jgi:hypothetical protein
MTTKENREYKNSVFVDLFFEDESARENDIALYNALHDEPLPEGTTVERIRIEDTLYMNIKNDISFMIGEKVIIFGEHQSTINENMPLRSLMHIGRFYELMVDREKRYMRKRVPLPKPEFYTFYNGLESWGKEMTLNLSDSYKVQDKNPMLEVVVKVININPQEGHIVLERCPILKEYGLFVDTIRRLQDEGNPEPFKDAIEQCIQSGILSDYLKKRGSEVYNMLIAKYDYETDIKVQRQEAREEGREEVLEALNRTKQVFKLRLENKSPEEIAKICKVSLEDVKAILD